MRLWSIHPKYLDQKGIVAVWREALLAQAVLLGQTKGYKNHPQLNRFKSKYNKYPINKSMELIGQYLLGIYNESVVRGYKFDINKIELFNSQANLIITKGQLVYELKHLYEKIKIRDKNRYNQLHDEFFGNIEGMIEIEKIEAHPLFRVINGGVESWEKIKKI